MKLFKEFRKEILKIVEKDKKQKRSYEIKIKILEKLELIFGILKYSMFIGPCFLNTKLFFLVFLFLPAISILLITQLDFLKRKIQKEYKIKNKEKILPIILKYYPNISHFENPFTSKIIKESGIFFHNNERVFQEKDDEFIIETSKNKFGMVYELAFTNEGIFKPQWLIIELMSSKKYKENTLIINKNQSNYITHTVHDCLHFIHVGIFGFLMIFCIFLAEFYQQGNNGMTENEAILYALTFTLGLILISFIILCIRRKKMNQGNVFLEDVNLMKNFKITSTNQIDARILLTPAFIERFKQIRKVFKTNEIRCAYYKDKIILAIRTKEDLFDFGMLFETNDYRQQLLEFRLKIREIERIINQID